MKVVTRYVQRKGKMTEVDFLAFSCPYCSEKYLAEQDELDKFETYTCPKCFDDIYFEDAEIL